MTRTRVCNQGHNRIMGPLVNSGGLVDAISLAWHASMLCLEGLVFIKRMCGPVHFRQYVIEGA